MTGIQVTNKTRAGADGRPILSPCCLAERVVYHFSWSAILCPDCAAEVEKRRWLLPTGARP